MVLSTRTVEVSVDPEANASYVSFRESGSPPAPVGTTIPVSDSEGRVIGALDFDESGRVVGLELLRAASALPGHWLDVQQGG